MRRFDYLAPASMPEALAMLAARPEAVPLAGGTDLLVQLKDGRRRVETLLSLKRVPEVHRCGPRNGALSLGSAVTLAEIVADPEIRREMAALSMAACAIGSVQVRNLATMGGNLCNAAPSADTAPALLVLGARAAISGPKGERLVPLEAFFLGPGRTALDPGELLAHVVVPSPAAGSGSCYLRHTPRARMDIAVAGAAAFVTLDAAGRLAEVRLALGAVAPVPMRAFEAEALLRGYLPTERLLREASAVAASATQPIDDLRASAEYRRHLAGVLAERALRGALAQAAKARECEP